MIASVLFFICKTSHKFWILQEKLEKLYHVVQGNIAGIRVVKAYLKEEYESERFKSTNRELTKAQLNILLLISYMTPLMNIIMNMTIVAIIKVGGSEVKAGAVIPGEVMAAIRVPDS